MKKFCTLILFGVILFASGASAENIGSLISPGELSKAHAKWDGIKNCTKCHALGGGVPDAKCLICHDKLAEQIKNQQGLHAKFKDPCIKCHSEHKGSGYKLYTIDEKTFDHDLTGYPLVSKHASVECSKCHTKKETYKGLSKDCIACHKDYHNDQLGKNCSRCHDVTGWKDLRKFNHDTDSKFILTGKHIDTKCEKCHVKNNYRIEQFDRCTTCHKDPHRGSKPKCADCHTTDSWKKVNIDHSKTKYPLTNKHREVGCDKCHKQGKLTGLPFATCNGSNCHEDVHKNQFKNKLCEACHTTAGFKPSLFKHNAPEYKGFKLDGKHIDTPCEKCHVDGRYKPIPYKTCDGAGCHKDVHKGQFKGRLCEACHTAAGFKPSLFKHNAPEYKGFKLDGKHIDTPCEKCHVDGKFKPLPNDCASCHIKDDVHKKELGNTCNKCHVTESWKKLLFDHNRQSQFPLIGKHKETECEKCHQEKKYKIKKEKCSECHEDYHKGEFKGSCNTCHTPFNWEPRKFNHEKEAGLKLQGVHNDLPCTNCHVKKGIYKGAPRFCSECHIDPHFNQFGIPNCSQCHTQTSWNPLAFNHNKTGFPLTGNHRTAECQDCHQNRLYRNIPTACIGCHSSNYSGALNHVAMGYSQDCRSCHTTSFITWDFSHLKISGSTPCAMCHLKDQPADHVANNFGTACESCHKYPTWDFNHATVSGSTACSVCHLKDQPADHVANNFGTACQTCHQYPTWSFNHATVSGSTACSVCHLKDQPADHVTNNFGTACQTCHQYPTWSFNHATVSATTTCSVCHLKDQPADHVANNFGTACQTCHQYPTWSFNHASVAGSTACSVCHLSNAPASHTTNNYGTACQNCHQYPTWAFNHTTAQASAACSSCHLSAAPASHTTNNYGTACQNCHVYPTWTFTHPIGTVACSLCHLSNAPSAHTLYSNRFGTACENCHTYPSWTPATFNHSFSTFPTNHKGYTLCSDCHPNQNYGNKGGCIECHTATGAKVHNTNQNSVCLSCHPTGKAKPLFNILPRGK